MLRAEECMDMIDLRQDDLQALGHPPTLIEALGLLERFSHMRAAHAADQGHAPAPCYPDAERRTCKPAKRSRGRARGGGK